MRTMHKHCQMLIRLPIKTFLVKCAMNLLQVFFCLCLFVCFVSFHIVLVCVGVFLKLKISSCPSRLMLCLKKTNKQTKQNHFLEKKLYIFQFVSIHIQLRQITHLFCAYLKMFLYLYGDT